MKRMKMINKNVLLIIITSLVIYSCDNKENDNSITDQEVDNNIESDSNIKFSISPIDLYDIDAKFAKDISYDSKTRTVFDIWLPSSDTATGLLIYIHGGGFTQGDKSIVYHNYNTWTFPEDIRTFLRNNIAVATINYSLLDANESEGLLKPLNDCKRALQYIKSKASEFNIDKNNIVLSGNSAGAGSSLWIGTQDDMIDINSNDIVLRESTRVKAIAIRESQATYNFERWTTDIFPEYGINFIQLVNSSSSFRAQISRYYGINNVNQYNTPEIDKYKQDVDMLAFLSNDDPEIYVNNTWREAEDPFAGDGDLVHHPYHARAIKSFADQVGVNTVVYYNDDPYPYSDSSNETWVQFIIRKVNE